MEIFLSLEKPERLFCIKGIWFRIMNESAQKTDKLKGSNCK